MKRVIIQFVFSLLLFSVNADAQKPAANIPEFTFYRFDKTTFTNKDLATGKPLFFIFFDVSCEHCQETINYINQHYREFKKASICLITLDDMDRVDNFMNRYGPDLRIKDNVILLRDMNNEFISKFRPGKYPSMFLYSSKWRLLLYSDEEASLPRFVQLINTGGK